MGGSKRPACAIVAIAAVFQMTGCSAVNPTIIDPIISAVDGSVGERVEIDFGSLVDGNWDELGIVCAFTSSEKVEEGLGFEWPGAPQIESAARDFLVFARENEVVAWTEVPIRISFCTYGEESTDGIRVVLREQSQMTLVRTTVDDPVGTIDEFWLVDPNTIVVDRAALEGVAVP